MRVVALVNPAAQHGFGGHVGDAAIDALRQRGVEVEVHVSEGTEHAAALASEAVAAATEAPDEHDAVVVIGGDGSVMHVLQAIWQHKSPIAVGLIPAGSGNDLARAAGIPVDDPVAAAHIVAAGHATPVDLAVISDDTGAETAYATIASSGLDALVTERANALRYPKGKSRYSIAAVIEFLRLSPRQYTITVDGEVHRASLAMASVGNTVSYGGGMRICPNARYDDGLLDVTTVAAGSRLRIARFFLRMFSGTHVGHPGVETYRGRQITLAASTPTIVYADGDPAGELPLTFTSAPAALNLLVPQEK